MKKKWIVGRKKLRDSKLQGPLKCDVPSVVVIFGARNKRHERKGKYSTSSNEKSNRQNTLAHTLPAFQTPRRELKPLRLASEYIERTLQCLEMRWNAVYVNSVK